MNSKKIQIIAFAAFVLIAGLAIYMGVFGNSSNNSDETERTAQQVQILKYSDFQCPACKTYVPAVKELKREFGDLIDFDYRHFPLDGFQYSRIAAHSAEAAREQDKFMEMHDLIFEYQEEWSQGGARKMFFKFAERLDLDMEQFEEDIESEEIARRVESQKQEGIRRMVNSTPTFFLNGQRLRQNPQNYEQFKSIVELYMYRSN